MEQFVRTIATLRSPEGCPWDREQTHLSIARNMIEEAHEAAWAIEQGDVANLREELGDVLLQVVLQAQMAAEAGEFTINDVITDINDKILRRHPHVFGDEAAFAAAHFSAEQVAQIQAARTAGEVIDLWDQIKLHEKAQKAARRPVSAAPEGLLDGVPQSLPALMQAQDISRKAVAAGFEWPTVNEIWQQVFSEIDEFNAAERGSDHAEEEFGDILFSLVNVARKEGVDAESALRASCRKFRRRWAIMEQLADERGYRLTESGTERLETLWQEAKGNQPSGLLSGEAANAAGEPLNA
jgi:tetrapyrrole methylase family protein/MazG family protein